MRNHGFIKEQAEKVRFVDPLTGLAPTDEVTLSALLPIFHYRGRIDWSRVPLRKLDRPLSHPEESANFVISGIGCLSAEYPLFWQTEDQEQSYGGMRPDFIYLSSDNNTVALIENKIGSGLTHKGDSYGGQFGRYIKYMLGCNISRKFVLLVTLMECLKKNWYTNELVAAMKLQDPDRQIECRILLWEDIWRALS